MVALLILSQQVKLIMVSMDELTRRANIAYRIIVLVILGGLGIWGLLAHMMRAWEIVACLALGTIAAITTTVK